MITTNTHTYNKTKTHTSILYTYIHIYMGLHTPSEVASRIEDESQWERLISISCIDVPKSRVPIGSLPLFATIIR